MYGPHDVSNGDGGGDGDGGKGGKGGNSNDAPSNRNRAKRRRGTTTANSESPFAEWDVHVVRDGDAGETMMVVGCSGRNGHNPGSNEHINATKPIDNNLMEWKII